MLVVVHPCGLCLETFYEPKQLRAHKPVCSQRNFCVTCKKDYPTSLELQTHLSQAHGSYQSCKFCDRHYAAQEKLDEHYTYQHSFCRDCKLPFSTRGELWKHRMECPDHYDCPLCGLCFPTKGGISKHFDEKH
ncbi:hypothetical protein K466DRAFT_589783 [Polyporus arcularius HHB13444]|uniref:C2H2-type domain-containing protein n=1 Tax=Polyporus arcularius HHB13444 TaxID=1314778 RepID=A0A5C3P1K8_9APHY|nr:hypothetical protein K466DRAFT_589783 [Polyporus arcularius HHB13444]